MLLGSFIKSRKLIVTFVLLKLNRVWFKSMLWSQQPVKSRKRLAIWLSHIYSKYRYKRSRNRICEGKFALLSQTNTFTLLLSSYPNVDICSQVNSLLNTPLVLSLHTRLSRFVYQFVTVYMHWSPISPANGMKCVQTMIAQYALESRNAILHSNHCCFWLALEISNASRVVCDGFLVWVKDFQETLSYFISWSTFKSSVAAEPLTETVRFSLGAKKYLFATRCFFMI